MKKNIFRAVVIGLAALTLSGELGNEQKAYYFGDTVTEGKADTSAYKYVLATATSEGGSYCAVVLKKV